MVRMQVQFDASEVTALRRAAAQRGTSISAVVREAVDRCVLAHDDRAGAITRAMAVVGKYASGAGDAAGRHDEYFAGSADE